MAKITKRNRDRLTLNLKSEEIEMLLYVLRIAYPQTKGRLETFVFGLWDQLKVLPEAKDVIQQIGDL